MRNSNRVSSENFQVPYARKRDHPQFHGMRRSDSTLVTMETKVDATSSQLLRSLSSIWDLESKDSTPDGTNTTASLKSNTPNDADELLDSLHFDDEEIRGQKLKNAYEKKDFLGISLPQCAASFYGCNKLTEDSFVVKTCSSVCMLNEYLRAKKAELSVGVAGKFLHAVIGKDLADVGAVVSTILYAFFLNITQNISNLCIVPIINMERAELRMNSELKWLIDSCRVDESSLVFIDEIELSYYEKFGGLNLVLVNGKRLSKKQEGLKEALVETFKCEKSSCCAIVAENFAKTSPEILAGQGFCRLLLSGILLDTANLADANCTNKDKYMATLLIKGAGRFGTCGLYEILRHKQNDISHLKVREILYKEFNKWKRVAGLGKTKSSAHRLLVFHIGMCSIELSIEELLAREDSAAEEVILFRESEKLQLLMIVSGYYDKQKNFKREILVSTNTAEVMRNFLEFFNTNGTHLPLKSLDLLDKTDKLKAFEIDNKATARRSIELLLEEFGGLLWQQWNSHLM